MRRRLIPLAAILVPAICAGARLSAQVQQGGAARGTLVIADPRATAITEYQAALDAYQAWSWTEGYARAQRALALDSSFGLARALVARYRGGPNGEGERNRAAVDAARGSAAEAVTALAIRAGAGAGAPTLWDAAVALAPNDPRLALDRALALAGRARVDALRETAKKFADHAATKQWLGYYLTPNVDPGANSADAAEAMAAVQDAVRLAANTSGSHTAMAHVLARLGREDEALRHLQAATSMTPTNEYAFRLRAEIHLHQGKPADARVSMDSAIILADNISQLELYRTQRALTFLHEGNLPATVAAMEENARSLEIMGAPVTAASARLYLAMVLAGGNNAKAANEQVALARRLGAGAVLLTDNSIIVYSLTRQGPAARQALNEYLRLAHGAAPSEALQQNIHRMTGLTLLGEGKPTEAIAELKQGGPNSYSQLGLIEAYVQLGDKKQVDAERATFLARKDYVGNSTAAAIGRYRSMMAAKK